MNVLAASLAMANIEAGVFLGICSVPPGHSSSGGQHSEVEATAARVQLSLVLPLVLAVLRVECAQLQRLQLEREPRPELLQTRPHFLPLPPLLIFLLEHIAMVAKEDEISLVVHRHYLSSPELWIVWHKTTKKPPNAVAEACVEIIQYKLRAMPSLPAVPTDGLWHHQVRELEACRRPMRKFDHPKAVARFCLLCEDEEQSEVTLTGCLDDLLNGYCAPLPILAIGEKVNHHLKKG
eukprot:CAMPEP_0181227496 /NCGR_PEP_ID=MMETSP1096-20121128/32821_1 /TAXON_ID=156174 ORGANISM="Chrysochromulina ericina, Strain CCMP281" /NCGR_SAMPLE_ID=MMETSP1096 /ASSEMBLY_ACC=CAM_ASM_000453 /LENGTH=235 /DNA_ID=CAMNT_0023320909 /DNA_START=262 /DNA_END=969 /DNA_ORIENTATION=+